MPKPKVTSMTPLTVMNDIDGSARSEDCESAGIIEASDVSGIVRDLMERESEALARAFAGHWTTTRTIHLCAVERGVRASGIGDGEAIFGERAQDSTGIVEKLEGLVAGVEDGRGDLQVLQSFDLDIWDRGLYGQARSSRDDNGRSDKGNENSTEGRGHRTVGSGCGWRDDSTKPCDR